MNVLVFDIETIPDVESGKKIYDLDVTVIPTNMPMIRHDFPDVIYKTRKEKFEAALDEIETLHEKGQPVLVGTISIDVSESLSKKLTEGTISFSSTCLICSGD